MLQLRSNHFSTCKHAHRKYNIDSTFTSRPQIVACCTTDHLALGPDYTKFCISSVYPINNNIISHTHLEASVTSIHANNNDDVIIT